MEDKDTIKVNKHSTTHQKLPGIEIVENKDTNKKLYSKESVCNIVQFNSASPSVYESKSALISSNSDSDLFSIKETYFNSKIKNENGDVKHFLVREIKDVHSKDISNIVDNYFAEDVYKLVKDKELTQETDKDAFTLDLERRNNKSKGLER